jgi:hypothetical protein
MTPNCRGKDESLCAIGWCDGSVFGGVAKLVVLGGAWDWQSIFVDSLKWRWAKLIKSVVPNTSSMRGGSKSRPPKLHLDTRMPPHSPIAGHFQGKLTSQVRRVLPAYLAVIFLLFFFANTHFFTAPIRAVSKHRREVRYQQPLVQSRSLIPRKIWQTWKVGPLGFEQRDSDSARTWPAKNPTYRYEVLTDDNALEYLEWHYGPQGLNRPDFIEFYRELNITIIKADLLRYLVMYAEGGVYADVSVHRRI